MHKTFHFSISQALRDAWATFTSNLWYFLGMSGVMVVLGFGSDERRVPLPVMLITTLVSLIVSMAWLKISLAVARKHEDKLSFARIGEMLPTLQEFAFLIGVYLLSILFIFAGLVVFIIPGIYIALRLSFAALAYLDRREGVRASVRFSWTITKGVFWTVLLTALVTIALYVVGAIAFGIGLLVTYPIAAILMAKLYVALVDHHTSIQVDAEPAPAPALPQEPAQEPEAPAPQPVPEQ